MKCAHADPHARKRRGVLLQNYIISEGLFLLRYNAV
jgi:hypothetical protein